MTTAVVLVVLSSAFLPKHRASPRKAGRLIELFENEGRNSSGTSGEQTNRKVAVGLHYLKFLLPVAIAACSGVWANGMPIAYGKGSNFKYCWSQISNTPVRYAFSQETAAMVKVSKADRRVEYEGGGGKGR